MSFVSSVIIGMVEKELASQTPEMEAFLLNLLGTVAKDVVQYVEKKVGIMPQASENSDSSTPNQ